MSIYPPNTIVPKKGSDGYLWNWLGSSLKKFAAALSPYLGGGEGYKKYVALLTQTGTNPPTADVLENTLGGDVIYLYDAPGIYRLVLPVAFQNNKLWFSGIMNENGTYGTSYMRYYQIAPNEVVIVTLIPDGTTVNDALYTASIEIRVYP